MRKAALLGFVGFVLVALFGRSDDTGLIVDLAPMEAAAQEFTVPAPWGDVSPWLEAVEAAADDDGSPLAHVGARLAKDMAALKYFRPGYAFWQHIFTIPDGSVAFGSGLDGRLLALFPSRGNPVAGARWQDASLASLLDGQTLPNDQTEWRDLVAALLQPQIGPVLHNATRGDFLLPNARRYGVFLSEWAAIYERFGIPAEIGLAQAMIESGLNGTVRSEAGAIGLCQWLTSNWNRLKRLAANEIEGYNQTTQAPYCAAYLTILSTKYGSFIPALSEHHAGGVNVGRTLINGQRLGGRDVRDQYFLGSELALELRKIEGDYSDIYRTYGPRSFLYAEMVFGNTANVVNLLDTIPQREIFAMRARRNLPIAEVVQRSGLSTDEVKRYNPALVRQVPVSANVYLPAYIADFGPDVSFWHKPPSPEYIAVLNDFVRLDATSEQWDSPAFEPILREYQRRFRATGTEEGGVMAAMLAYVIDETYNSSRMRILTEFRESFEILDLFQRGVQAVQASRQAQVAGIPE